MKRTEFRGEVRLARSVWIALLALVLSSPWTGPARAQDSTATTPPAATNEATPVADVPRSNVMTRVDLNQSSHNVVRTGPGKEFAIVGAGSSIMEGRSELTFNYGAGTMLYLSKNWAMRWKVRAFRFDSGSDNARTSNSNIAFTFGSGFLY